MERALRRRRPRRQRRLTAMLGKNTFLLSGPGNPAAVASLRFIEQIPPLIVIPGNIPQLWFGSVLRRLRD